MHSSTKLYMSLAIKNKPDRLVSMLTCYALCACYSLTTLNIITQKNRFVNSLWKYIEKINMNLPSFR